MQYALLIYTAEELWDAASETERDACIAAHSALQADTKKSGEFLGTVRLMPSATATQVRHGGTDAAILDGPFLETKELFAGFYLLDCESLDEAG